MTRVKYVIVIDENGEFHVPNSHQDIIKEAQKLLDNRFVTVGDIPSDVMFNNAMEKLNDTPRD